MQKYIFVQSVRPKAFATDNIKGNYYRLIYVPDSDSDTYIGLIGHNEGYDMSEIGQHLSIKAFFQLYSPK